MEIKRRPFQGVLNILNLNRHFSYYGFLALILILLLLYLFGAPSIWYWVVLVGFGYGLLIPLVVSAYVYDFSQFYQLHWLTPYVTQTGSKLNLVNINAGFDETSFLLKSKLPDSKLQVFDFYNRERHTEPAIVRARKISQVYPNTREIGTAKIPIEDQSADFVFLLSAVHEIRDAGERVEFLKECRRICDSDGRLIVVEHLRDLPNFLAFTFGFTHFFSRKTWKGAFLTAGYTVVNEKKFTPFMSIFECKP